MWLTTWNPASRTVEIGAVTVLLLFAAALRIIGISAGAPDMAYFPADAAQNLLPIEAPIHPDEFLYVSTPLHMRAKHRLNPDFFENPTFLINLNLLTYIVTGTGSDLVWEAIKEIGQRQIAPFSLYVIGRWYSVLGGLLAVAATYAAARVVAGRFAALSAGLLVAVALPMVQHAHYATTSSLAAGFVALCLWASFAFVRQRRWRLFVLACLAAGFAATNRYNAAAVALVPFALGSVLIWRKQVKPLPVLLFTLPVVQRFAATDTRLLMTAWITEHIPAGARIHLDGSYNVPLDRTRYSVTQNYAGDFPTLETLCQAEYVIFSDAWFNDVERSQDLVSATDLELARGQRALLETQLVELARIERPLTLGRDLFMHTATYWHDPQIIVYRVPAACSGG